MLSGYKADTHNSTAHIGGKEDMFTVRHPAARRQTAVDTSKATHCYTHTVQLDIT